MLSLLKLLCPSTTTGRMLLTQRDERLREGKGGSILLAIADGGCCNLSYGITQHVVFSCN